MLLHKHSDQELIRSYLEGDESSLSVLINRHQSRIFSYILVTVKDRALAEDFFQDTFIKVINTLKLGRYNEEGKFLPWVLRIAHNLVIDHFRRQKKMKKVDVRSRDNEELDIFNTIPVDEMNIEDLLVDQQIKSDVVKLLEFLPEEQKEVVFLRHFKGLSFKDIAEETNVSINTALGRMRYALLNMRKVAEDKGMVLTLD